MAQQTAPPDDSNGLESLYILGPFMFLGIVFFIVRIYTRLALSYKLNVSDYTNAVAVLAATITFGLFITAIVHGFGHHSFYITPEDSVIVFKCLYVVLNVGLFAAVFARISVACLCLQFTTSTVPKIILRAQITFQIASLIATAVATWIQCRPISAFWEAVPGGKCFSPPQSWAFTAIGIASDLVCAVIPILVISKLSRSLVERCLVCFLMAMSLFATAAGVLKIIYSYRFDHDSSDALRDMMPLFLWCRMEEVLLIIACEAPFLKSSIERVLRRMGLPVFQQKTKNLNSIHTFPDPRGSQGETVQKDKRMKIDERKLEACEYTTSEDSTQSDESDGNSTRQHGEATDSSQSQPMSTPMDDV